LIFNLSDYAAALLGYFGYGFTTGLEIPMVFNLYYLEAFVGCIFAIDAARNIGAQGTFEKVAKVCWMQSTRFR
jgi:hypothetical protein